MKKKTGKKAKQVKIITDTNLPKATQDPYANREAKHYTNPIASREHILGFLKTVDVPLSFHKLAKGLSHHKNPDELSALSRRVRAMLRDGQLLQNDEDEYTVIDDENLVKGKVSGHRDGFGFLTVLSDDRKDIYLTPRQMRLVFPGDEVMVHPGNKRKEATIIEVLSHNTREIVGRCVESRKRSTDLKVIPMDSRITQAIQINRYSSIQPEPGQIVVVQITEYPTRKNPAIGDVIDILDQQQIGVKLTIDIAIRMHDLPYQWSEAILSEISQFPDNVTDHPLPDRRDLRDYPFVTIDGMDAKDFDDAVFCKPDRSGGWRLFVAIADVSHYVKPHSLLDDAAYERGNSVYFPGKVVPMLPEALSNGLCSLKPEVDRLSLVCEMHFDHTGHLQHYEFYHAIIHSHARLVYEDVSDLLTKTGCDDPQKQALRPHLQCLHDLYDKLHVSRTTRGALDLDFTEPYFEFDDNGEVDAIKSRKRTLSHRIIEECMLIANVCAAKFVAKRNIPTLFRIHHRPPPEKLAQLREFISVLGLELHGGNEPLAGDYAKLLSDIETRDDAMLIQMVMLRSLSQAIYGPDNEGHFALAYDAYGHFTSPIRRYPDLIMHRAISHLIHKKPKESFPYSAKKMAELGEHCSMTERRADEVTRRVTSTLKCQFMQNKLGQLYDGMIINVTNFGFFVELDQIFVEGLVHITHLNDDHYSFDPAFHRLIGRHKKNVYALGDKVKVEVLNVNPNNQRIELGLIKGKKK